MTAAGPVTVRRSHGYCRDCGQPGFAADALVGLDGWLTLRARGMVALAGLSDPFRKAGPLLEALAGWSVCAETVRRCCHRAAADARARRGELDGLPEEFATAGGDRELHIDAGKVNTPGGWRDVKVAVFACRERGEPALPEDYEQRDLPGPGVRCVVAEVEEAQAFGPRCLREARRLGVAADGSLSVLGDGAEWIWNIAEQHFAEATQVLDVYHGVEHLAGAAREAFGPGPAMREWLDKARQKLIADGYDGACRALAEPIADAEARRRMDGQAAGVLGYLGGQKGRLGYAERLRRGQAIGSGLVEGTIKQRVNLRLKRAAARWLPHHVGPFVEMMALADSPEWPEFWGTLAA